MPLMPFNATMRKTRNQLSKYGSSNMNDSENVPVHLNKKNGLGNTKNDSENIVKRKADDQILNANKLIKRSAFGDITNALEKNFSKNGKKEAVLKTKSKSYNAGVGGAEITLKKVSVSLPPLPKQVLDLKNAVNDICKISSDQNEIYTTVPEEETVEPSIVPEGVEDYDKAVASDPFAVSCYVMDIFKYYRQRENGFTIKKYLPSQPDINKSMRAILVDWMVEVQESFELNHETLYLAVKIVDLYLSKERIARDRLQLVGSTAIFIACKFDERTPPCIDDFMYICNDAYTRNELIKMEITLLKKLNFDLGIPLSYRFLRRYARCSKISMETLTFARYILESSLLEYDLIELDGSLLAAAALYLALYVKEKTKQWSPTLQYYSDYKLEDFYHIVHLVHQMLIQPPKDHLKTIKNKYSHRIFFEVAKIPIPDEIDI